VKAPTVVVVKDLLGAQSVQSLITLIVAFLLWRLSIAGITKFYARRFVSRFIPRVPTYASITKSIVAALIWVAAIIELLHIWKVDVTPALWSAGLFSVVIAIGAQATVRDLLTGAFFLFEDAFDVGDGVELTTTNGVVTGIVEAVNLRETRIVDMRGYLVSIPNGSIVFVANTTRLPARHAMRVTLPLRSDVSSLRQRVTEIVNDSVRSSDFGIGGAAVRLVDITPDTASFSIDFQVPRQHAIEAESTLRERIVAKLQADGLLPGGQKDQN
jgi:moderate conductance mechanosensitive channel